MFLFFKCDSDWNLFLFIFKKFLNNRIFLPSPSSPTPLFSTSLFFFFSAPRHQTNRHCHQSARNVKKPPDVVVVWRDVKNTAKIPFFFLSFFWQKQGEIGSPPHSVKLGFFFLLHIKSLMQVNKSSSWITRIAYLTVS